MKVWYNIKLFFNSGLIILTILITFQLNGCKNKKGSSGKDISEIQKTILSTSSNWQLFIDDYWIANSENIKSSMHQPVRHVNNPLIRAEIGWEENPYCFGTAIYDEEEHIFKFWYQSYNYTQELPDRTPILYATSIDGLKWERPNLGVTEFQGSKENNIIFQNYGYHDLYSPSVTKDITDPDPNRRYKMIWWDFPLGDVGYQDDGMCVAFSPDGINWAKYSGNPVLHANKTEQSISDVMSVMYDNNTGKFVAYTKGWAKPWPSFRQIVRTESKDFIQWLEPKVVISHKHDLKDPQSYGMTVSQFGNNYIGLMYSYKNPGDETIDVQLCISHDNNKWNRVANQKTFLPLGEANSWDDGMIFCAPMFNHGNETLIYYSGWDNSHNSKKTRRSGIGLASLRLNGFISLDAGQKMGIITTHSMLNAMGPLFVNLSTAGGSLRAELLDAEEKPIPGFTLDDCIAIESNDITQLIQWRKHSKLPETKKPLRIRFHLINASLYGFYAGPDLTRNTN